MYNTKKLQARVAKIRKMKELLLNTKSRQISPRTVVAFLFNLLIALDEIESLLSEKKPVKIEQRTPI